MLQMETITGDKTGSKTRKYTHKAVPEWEPQPEVVK